MKARVAACMRIGALVLTVCACPLGAAADRAGWEAYAQGDFARARSAYLASASGGDRLAQYNLAIMLLRGEGGPVDAQEGAAWLAKAAEAGMAQAQYNLGVLYEGGVGVTRSLTAATTWWQRAAEQGHT